MPVGGPILCPRCGHNLSNPFPAPYSPPTEEDVRRITEAVAKLIEGEKNDRKPQSEHQN